MEPQAQGAVKPSGSVPHYFAYCPSLCTLCASQETHGEPHRGLLVRARGRMELCPQARAALPLGLATRCAWCTPRWATAEFRHHRTPRSLARTLVRQECRPDTVSSMRPKMINFWVSLSTSPWWCNMYGLLKLDGCRFGLVQNVQERREGLQRGAWVRLKALLPIYAAVADREAALHLAGRRPQLDKVT